MSLIYKNAIGATITVITGNTTLDISSVVILEVKKPTGASPETWTPTFDSATGIATYKTIAGDLDELGEYRVQVFATGATPTTFELPSDIDYFIVYDKL